MTMSEPLESNPPVIRIRMQISLANVLLGEYFRASKIAHEQGLEPPELPPNVEEAFQVKLGVQVIEMEHRSRTFKDAPHR